MARTISARVMSSTYADVANSALSHLSRVATRERLERVTRAMDTAVRVPGTGFRFGADAVLNVIPGLGTAATTLVSAWIIWEARRMGAPKRLIGRMLGNVALDAAISSVPVIGWLGDAAFRANTRNMALLRRHLDGPGV